MWNDNETDIDLIDFQHLVGSVVDIISSENLLPCTIGLYGDWGSGKSSLMRMVETAFSDKEDVLTIKFNGWLFEGYEDAKSVLMGTILDELIKKKKPVGKAKNLAKKLLKKVDWMKVAIGGAKAGLGVLALGPAGLSLAGMQNWIKDGVLEDLSKIDYEHYFKENPDDGDMNLRMGIREFHKDFSDLLKETGVNKLIVFIDDLDRCNPNTVIDTLEAIKLFLFVKNSAFVISADERLIKYAVRQRFPEIPGEGLEIGRDYLEKLIQFPIRIPQLNQSELETYINLLFTQLHISDEEFENVRKKALENKANGAMDSRYNYTSASEILNQGFVDELKSDMVLASQITPVLAVGLKGNPRQSKRFLNTLLLRIGMAKSKKIDLKRSILSKLMLLEYFKPEKFRLLFKLQASQSGIPQEINMLEESEGVKDKEKPVKKRKKEEEADISDWLSDDWLKNWIKQEPYLGSVDLSPYYYFSRDATGSIPVIAQRMSTGAQDVLQKLLSGSESIRNDGLQKATALNEGDAATIFASLREKLIQQENRTKRKDTIQTLLEFCRRRLELLSELSTFLKNLSDEEIPFAIVPTVWALFEESNNKAIGSSILTKWQKSTDNKKLAAAAKNYLQQR